MNTSFNLVDREWIPCVKQDGSVVYKGLLATLVEAEQFNELRDASPLVTISLHRLLLAILHRVFGPKTPTIWAQLWNKGNGRFDSTKMEAYLRSEKVYSRFDLFEAKHPFYQTAALSHGELQEDGRYKYVKPIWQMAHELKYSDSMNLFAHFKETDWEIRPSAEAARWLVAFQGFALGGRITFAEGESSKTEGSADAGQLTKSAVVLARGDNFFQTLMLNLVHYSEEDDEPFSFDSSVDKPAWERDTTNQPPADRSFDGYLDLLTWQSRRVRLVPECDDKGELHGVSGVVTMKGWQLPGFERYDRETMVGFVKNEKATPKTDPWPPLGFHAERNLWRDSHALFLSIAEKSERPKVLSWIDALRQDGHLDRKNVQLDTFGMSANQAKILLWRHESLPLPLAYLDNPELVESLKLALKLAENVARIVRVATYQAVIQIKHDIKPTESVEGRKALDFTSVNDRLKKKKPDPIGARVKSLAPERGYWSRLDLRFRELLSKLAEAADSLARTREVGRWFHADLEPLARDAFAMVSTALSGSHRELHGVAVGENQLNRRLRKLGKNLPKPVHPKPESTRDDRP